MSLPLILLNVYTLLSVLHKDDENLDLSRLISHLAEGINGNCPCPRSVVIGRVGRLFVQSFIPTSYVSLSRLQGVANFLAQNLTLDNLYIKNLNFIIIF